MCTEDEIKDDSEYADILEDVKDEMSKSGEVISVKIPRPQDENVIKETVGLIYVEFKTVGAAIKALGTVQGRTFNNKPVGTHYYPESDFAKGKLCDISKIAPVPTTTTLPTPPTMAPPPHMSGMMMRGGPPPPGPPPPNMRMGGFPPHHQQYRQPPPPQSAPMGGFPSYNNNNNNRGGGGGGVGRGRASTLPAWMKKKE